MIVLIVFIVQNAPMGYGPIKNLKLDRSLNQSMRLISRIFRGYSSRRSAVMPCEMKFYTASRLQPFRRIFTFHGLLFQVTRV